MFFSELLISFLFVVAVHGIANFTNSGFNNIEVSKPFNVTWKGNKEAVRIDLVNGDPRNLLLTKQLVPSLSGGWYNWVPEKNVPKSKNTLRVTDLKDGIVNYSLQFDIAGGDDKWAPTEDTSPAGTSTAPDVEPTSSPTSEAMKGGLSSTAKTAIYVAVPVVVIILGVCLGLWLRNRRNHSRLNNQPIRTMTSDNTPPRSKYDNRYNVPTMPEKAARGPRSQSHTTVDSGSTTNTFRKLFFNEKNVEPTIEQISTRSTNSDPERDATTPPRHRASTSCIDGTIVTPLRGDQRTTWDDTPTPPNNRRSGNENAEMQTVNTRRYPGYNGPPSEPESPTPQRRVVSLPVLERGFEDARESPAPNVEGQRWELSGGTPFQSHARLSQPPSELGQSQRTSSSPYAGSSTSSVRNDARRQDLYAGVTFGDSEDPDAIVRHLAAQREKVRAEQERIRKLQELATVEEELDRQINARQIRG